MDKYKKLKISILASSVLSFISFLACFFIPLFTSNEGQVANFTLINCVTLQSEGTIDEIVIFAIYIVLLLISLVWLIFSLQSYFSNYDEKFLRFNNACVILNFSFDVVFFITGIILCLVYNSKFPTENFQTLSYLSFLFGIVPLLLSSILTAIFNSTYDLEEEPVSAKKRFKIEPLIFMILMTISTYITLFLSFLRISVDTQTISQIEINLNTLDLLQNYGSLETGNQLVAFIIIVVYILAAAMFLVSVASYITKTENYRRYIKIGLFTDFILMLVLGISGMYFSIATEVNKDVINSILELYGYTFDFTDYKFDIHSDYLYIAILEFLIIILAFARGIFKDDALEVEGSIEAKTSSNEEDLGNVSSSTGDGSVAKAEKPKDDEFNESINNSGQVQATSSTNSSDALFSTRTLTNFESCEEFTYLENKFKKTINVNNLNQSQNPKILNLKDLVSFIVEYAKNDVKHLSYTNQTIASFISGLGVSRLTILQGMSGTGKTSLPKIVSEALGAKCKIIEVASSWKDRNELIGYYNQFSEKFISTKFINSLYEAALNPDVIYFIVLDEMNLSRIEYYFSDFLSLMENDEDKRVLQLSNSPIFKYVDGVKKDYLKIKEGEFFSIPKNVWFVGTANNDESTFAISDKVYDRANVMNLNKRAKKIRNYSLPNEPYFMEYNSFSKMLDNAKKRINFDAENYEIIKKVEDILKPYNISFGNRILNQIENYVSIYSSCFDNDVVFEAVEDILLSKIVSKLENKVIEDKDVLISEFEELGLFRCVEFLKTLNED